MHETKERNKHVHRRWLGTCLSIDGAALDSARAFIRCERTNPTTRKVKTDVACFRTQSNLRLAKEPCTTDVSQTPRANSYRLAALSTACCNTDDTIRLETDKLGRYTAFYTALEDGQRPHYSYVQSTRWRRQKPPKFPL